MSKLRGEYGLIWTPGLGIGPLGWLWLILAVLLDLGGWGSTSYANRGRYGRPRA